MEEIYVLDKAVRLMQPDNGFRTSMDSVLLASACPAKKSETILDLGCGVGGASFCLLHREKSCSLVGIDLNEEYIKLANLNIALNQTENRSSFLLKDVCEFTSEERFNHVICNPPFMKAGAHTPSPDAALASANGFVDPQTGLEDWINSGFRNLKSKGSFTIIHRADHLDLIIRFMGKRFGKIDIIPLYPYIGRPAKRVIVRAVKDSRSPCNISSGLILHDEGGKYTDQADTILRGKSYFF